MDYSKFRDSSTKGEAVTVNHKALITRALTKYPVDFALFRELLQNSADAKSNSATIQFETSQPTFDAGSLHGAAITRLRFSNDGLEFAEDDWSRLREIASGNPNETKIGAFGVGFYSVFELTDEPLVHSGDKIMNFRYHGVQLHYYFTSKYTHFQKGTLIDLPYKEPMELLDLIKFTGFLLQSFLLVGLNEINLELKYKNGEVKQLLKLQKHTGEPVQLPMPRGFQTRSPNKTLNLSVLNKSDVEVRVKCLNLTQQPPLSLSQGFFSFGKQLVASIITQNGDPLDYSSINCKLIKFDGYADVSVSKAFRNKMIETLLKPPPKRALVSLVAIAEVGDEGATNQLKSYVIPKAYNDAKIFIGFATKQSTGLRSHLALNQLIPTMERTAVDMSNQFVKDWNSEMLYMAGIVSRFACEYELNVCKKHASIERASKDAELIWSRYKFGDSSPDTVIGLYTKSGFWKSSSTTLVPSSMGVLPNHDVRLASDTAKFLRSIPLVTDTDLANDLKAVNFIVPVSNAEIADDIRASPVSSELAKKFIKWLITSRATLGETTFEDLSKAMTISHSDALYNFETAKYYLDKSKLPDDEVAEHLPPNCLPSDLAIELGHQDLQHMGMQPLTVFTWTSFRFQYIEENSKATDVNDMTKVLQVICKTWDRISRSTRLNLVKLCSKYKCIPVNSGRCFPSQAYVKEMKLFPDLPVVSRRANLPETWLIELGVRGSMDMSFVLNALSDSQLQWKNEDLLQYLEENETLLTSSDWKVLREGRFFACGNAKGNSLYTAAQLYPPNVNLQRLLLPTIALGTWYENSKQAKILFKVGLKRHPAPNKLFGTIDNSSKCDIALQYFIDNFDSAPYSSNDIQDFAVLPIEGGSTLVKPSDCYADDNLAIFGLKVLKSRWHPFASRLGVHQSPSVSSLVSLVLKNPTEILHHPARCEKIFSYFAQHAGSFTEQDISSCKKAQFIPVKPDQGGDIEWFSPSQVFLPYHGTDAEEEDLLRPILKTVHPSRQSMPFYQLMGVHDRPTLPQLVQMVVRDPHKIYKLCPTVEHYESILNQMETKWNSLSRDHSLISSMKAASILIGYKYSANEDESGNDPSSEASLYYADQLAIVDDVIIYNQFKEKVITCPQQESLEKLYAKLGVPKLSQLLRENVSFGGVVHDESKRKALEERIHTRLMLFQENTSRTMKVASKAIEVVFVSSIECRRQLPPNSSILVFPTAFIHPSAPHKLCVVHKHYEWIDIATALVKALLAKPDQDAIVVLEIQLSADPDTLERKGYNVKRIKQTQAVKKKEAKMIVQEHNLSNDKSSALKPSNLTKETSQQNSKFSEPVNPENQPLLQSQSQPKPQQGQLPSPPQPNPVSNGLQKSGENNLSALKSAMNKPKSSWKQFFMGQQPSAQKHSVTSHPSSSVQMQNTQHSSPNSLTDINKTLQSGLSSAREYSASSLNKSIHMDRPAPMASERNCDGFNKASNLTLIGNLDCGMKVFSDSTNAAPRQDENTLGEALVILCSIYGYPQKAVSVFREQDSNVIAFNTNGSLFFNSWHVPSLPHILDYYYPIMAHELAHNLVTDHGASHNSFTESYIQFSLENYIHFRR